MKKRGKCVLCYRNRLLTETHIIPAALHYGIETKLYPLNSNKPPKISRTGIYDYLLCKECNPYTERTFESEGIRFINDNIDGQSNRTVWTDGKYIQELVGYYTYSYDWNKIKLFILNILYLASFSNHEFYRGFKVDDHNLAYIRSCILKYDTLDNDYVQIHPRMLVVDFGFENPIYFTNSDVYKLQIKNFNFYISFGDSPFADLINSTDALIGMNEKRLFIVVDPVDDIEKRRNIIKNNKYVKTKEYSKFDNFLSILNVIRRVIC